MVDGIGWFGLNGLSFRGNLTNTLVWSAFAEWDILSLSGLFLDNKRFRFQVRFFRPQAIFPSLVLLAAVFLIRATEAKETAPYPDGPYELAPEVRVAEPDSRTRSELNRARVLIQKQKFDEPIAILQRLVRSADTGLVAWKPGRYVPVQDHARALLAALPIEVIRSHRKSIDPIAATWYQDGLARQDSALLEKVVREAFLSSWTDDALLAMGDLALEAGDSTAARSAWRKILPLPPTEESPPCRWGCPDTDLDPASIEARFIVASILDGALVSAKEEYDHFVKKYPGARGRLGGQEVDLAVALQKILDEAASWAPPRLSPDWKTFAGNRRRNQIALSAAVPSRVLWQADLSAIASSIDRTRFPWPDAGPAFHPVYENGAVFVNLGDSIRAFRLENGKPLWGETAEVFENRPVFSAPFVESLPREIWGVPRFTSTVFSEGGLSRLYARVGLPVTGRLGRAWSGVPEGRLVCLDLRAEGRLLWAVEPDGAIWSFEGTPVASAETVWVAMRRSGIRPELHVAAFDAKNGQRRWRRLVVSAESASAGFAGEYSHHLLTLAGQTLYYNTNLGAVAALSMEDGRIRWLTLYPRQRSIDRLRAAAYQMRTLIPCLYDRGQLFVAPSDSPALLALDAVDGRILWRNRHAADVVDLLGVAGNRLIASGRRLYGIETAGPDAGKMVRAVPPEPSDVSGYGRAVLAGKSVWRPTEKSILVYDQLTFESTGRVDLDALGIPGGNLLVVDGRVLVTAKDRIVALGAQTVSSESSNSNPNAHEKAQ